MTEASELMQVYRLAHADETLRGVRVRVLEATVETLDVVARGANRAASGTRDYSQLAVGLLCEIALELTAGIQLSLEDNRVYAAACLLRQVIEIEYLMLLGCADSRTLSDWYQASPRDRRKQFSPKQMREASDGFFLDQEYWMHCEVGGHPNPRGRMLLPSRSTGIAPEAFLLPDSIQHIRRLWTSLRLLVPQLSINLDPEMLPLRTAISDWARAEAPIIEAAHGIGIDSDH